MYKPSIMLAEVLEPKCSRTMRLRAVLVIAIGIFLVPLAVETALLCYSQWCDVLGSSAEVPTPILDSIGLCVASAGEVLAESLGPPWRAATRDPYVALPLAVVCIIVATALLKW